MDSLRSPTSPRPVRPSGPRTLNRRTTGNIKAMPFALDPASPAESSSPNFSGHNSPTGTRSSQAGSVHSPATTDFELLPAPLVIPRAPVSEVRDAREWRDEGVQASLEGLTPSRPASTASSAPAVKVITKPPTLAPPPPLNFDSESIAWRGMPLETAQWTLSSPELQEIVSRSIRKTAQESFIRLLSLKTLDEELVAEMERLDSVRATAQSKYRFNMHRRTMLLQSLLALTSGESDCAAACSLTTQLAEVSVACDGLMLELVRVLDQRAQIQRVQEVHVSSALAMALRKLNASYAKRTGELREAREQVEHLKAELEEAWKVAEDMAQEMDDLDNFQTGFSTDSDEGEDDTRMDESVRLAEVIGVTGKAVAMRATLTQLHTTRQREREHEQERQRAERERARNDFDNHSQRVSAARRRSSRTSKASLRLPKTPKSASSDTPGERASITSRGSRRSRSKSLRRRSSAAAAAAAAAASAARAGAAGPSSYKPPMPTLQVDTASLKKSPKDDSFLEIETRPVSPASPSRSQPVPALPSNMEATIASHMSPQAENSNAKRATFDFEIPPITVSAPDDDTRSLGRSSTRRVQSMQPPMRARSQEPDDTRRTSNEYKPSDPWPWAGNADPDAAAAAAKKARRRSLPLTGLVGGAGPVDPPPRVFSPPPEYSAHARPGTSHN